MTQQTKNKGRQIKRNKQPQHTTFVEKKGGRGLEAGGTLLPLAAHGCVEVLKRVTPGFHAF
jgi:hypothetical protein